jgi:hypothetical protein
MFVLAKQSVQRIRLCCKYLWAAFGKLLKVSQFPPDGWQLLQVGNFK